MSGAVVGLDATSGQKMSLEIQSEEELTMFQMTEAILCRYENSCVKKHILANWY